jgi:hypothetical protein
LRFSSRLLSPLSPLPLSRPPPGLDSLFLAIFFYLLIHCWIH